MSPVAIDELELEDVFSWGLGVPGQRDGILPTGVDWVRRRTRDAWAGHNSRRARHGRYGLVVGSRASKPASQEAGKPASGQCW